MARLIVKFRVGDGPAVNVNGREAQTIVALVNAGPKGITSLDTFRAGWAVRLGAYIFDLRQMGVPIETTREPHNGGNHARYRLTGQIEILSISDPAAAVERAAA